MRAAPEQRMLGSHSAVRCGLPPRLAPQHQHQQCGEKQRPARQLAHSLRALSAGHAAAPRSAIGSRRMAPLVALSTATQLAVAQTESSTALARNDQIRYMFVVPEYISDFGQELKVVGSLPELGSWEATNAPRMQWCPGHRWKLEITLPKTPFEFKVVMMHGNFVRWEQGVNRVVQADADSENQLQGPTSGPVEVIIKVNCLFNQVNDTQLAVMVPIERMKEAFEVAQAALEMLEQRRNKLQKEVEKAQTGVSRQQEVTAMGEAVAGQKSSVDSLSQLIDQAGSDPEGCVAMPIARVHLPAGTPLGALPRLAAASFLPPDQATATIKLLSQAFNGAPIPRAAPGPALAGLSAAAAAGAAVGAPGQDQGLAGGGFLGTNGSWQAGAQDQGFGAAGQGAVQGVAGGDFLVSDGGAAFGGEASSGAWGEVEDVEQLQSKQLSQAKAALDLDSVVQRLQNFFARNPMPSGASPAEASGVVEGDGKLDGAAQEQVRELTALMAEAEGAWRVARELSASFEEEESEEEGGTQYHALRPEEPGLPEDFTQAAENQARAWEELARRMTNDQDNQHAAASSDSGNWPGGETSSSGAGAGSEEGQGAGAWGRGEAWGYQRAAVGRPEEAAGPGASAGAGLVQEEKVEEAKEEEEEVLVPAWGPVVEAFGRGEIEGLSAAGSLWASEQQWSGPEQVSDGGWESSGGYGSGQEWEREERGGELEREYERVVAEQQGRAAGAGEGPRGTDSDAEGRDRGGWGSREKETASTSSGGWLGAWGIGGTTDDGWAADRERYKQAVGLKVLDREGEARGGEEEERGAQAWAGRGTEEERWQEQQQAGLQGLEGASEQGQGEGLGEGEGEVKEEANVFQKFWNFFKP